MDNKPKLIIKKEPQEGASRTAINLHGSSSGNAITVHPRPQSFRTHSNPMTASRQVIPPSSLHPSPPHPIVFQQGHPSQPPPPPPPPLITPRPQFIPVHAVQHSSIPPIPPPVPIPVPPPPPPPNLNPELSGLQATIQQSPQLRNVTGLSVSRPATNQNVPPTFAPQAVSNVSVEQEHSSEIDIEDLYRAEIESLKEQLEAFHELCDSVEGKSWSTNQIIDYLNVLTKSLFFDAVALILLNQEEGIFYPVSSKGFNLKPTERIMNFWSASISSENSSIDWKALMALGQTKNTVLAEWIISEDFKNIGYIPIHDGHHILGFIFVGSREAIESNTFTSDLLEVCGSHLGLSLTLKQNACDLVNIASAIREVEKQFLIVNNCLNYFKEAHEMDQAQLDNFVKSCSDTVEYGINYLEQMANELTPPPHESSSEA